MHRHKGLAWLQAGVHLHWQYQAGASAAHADQIALCQARPGQIVGMQAKQGLFNVAEQLRCGAGPAHAVPLIAQSAGIEHQRKGRIGAFGRRHEGVGHEARAPRLGGEAAVGVQAWRTAFGTGGKRPLLRAETLELGPRQAAVVQIAPGGQLAILVVELLGTFEGEQARLTRAQVPLQAAGEIAGDGPVRARLAGCADGCTHWADAALGIGHGACLLAPARRRQQQIGIATGFGGGEGFLHHDERARGQRLMDGVLVRQRLRGVGTDDPQGLDSPAADRIEQLDGRQAGHLRQALDSPVRRNLGAVPGVGRIAMTGQQVGQGSGLASAHGVRLAGEREGAAAGAADLSGGQVQVDQRTVLRATGGGLVQPHAPQREKARCQADHPGAIEQLLRRDTAQLGDAGRRVVVYQGGKRSEALGVRRDEGAVDPAFAQQQVQQAMKQGHVGARANAQVQVGQLGGVGAAWIDDDDAHLRPRGLRCLQATEQHRVGIGHVAAGDQQHVGLLDVLVRAGWGVGAEAALVADHCRGHAQP